MLEFTTPPDNGNGATGVQAFRYDAAMLAETHVPLAGGASGVDPQRFEWVAGRLGDEDYLGNSPANAAYLERRMFAVMWARSCALSGRPQPLETHLEALTAYIDGTQHFLELLVALDGWSLDRPLTYEDVLTYPR